MKKAPARLVWGKGAIMQDNIIFPSNFKKDTGTTGTIDLAAEAKAIKADLDEVATGVATALDSAMRAGDKILKVEASKQISKGGWPKFYKDSGFKSARTGRVYRQLAENREPIEAARAERRESARLKRQSSAVFSIADALRLISKKKGGKKQKPDKNAKLEEITQYLKEIGYDLARRAFSTAFPEELRRCDDHQRSLDKPGPPEKELTGHVRRMLSPTASPATSRAEMDGAKNLLRKTGTDVNDIEVRWSLSPAKRVA